jgi:hypothetical protein
MPLTASQNDALHKATDLLKEHFDCSVIALDTENSEGTDRVFAIQFQGGVTQAIGLFERGSARMKKHALECEPDELK